MSSSDETTYSPNAIPKWKDWAEINHDGRGQYGTGPSLKDPNDPIQNSERANENHMEKAANAFGAGPSIRRPSNSPKYEHLEHRDEAQSPTQSPPQNYEFGHAPTANTATTVTSTKTREELNHHSALSSIRTKLGLEPEPPILEGHDVHHHLTWSSVRVIFREPFAEFFGVFIMVLFGDGSVAQVLLSVGEKTAPGMSGFGPYQSISWGWGLGVMLGIYVAGDSGGFLNPAITFCSCLFRKLSWKRFPIYFLTQVLGGFAGSGVVYANYINAINQFEGHGVRTVPPASTATAAIFCTYPQAFMTKASQFFSGFIASTILMFVIFALKDDSNPGAMGKSGAGMLFPLALFFLIFGLGACFGWETGYAINLARDFGPRLMSYIVGYGHDVWSAGGYYFWIPMVAPFCGCTFGAFLYDFFIYTGPESPVNTPWLGFKDLVTGPWKSKRKPEKYDV